MSGDDQPHKAPLISGIRLENFKAFGSLQDIPIKPLTLIYGPNSSGKSSIIHGLLFLHEILVRDGVGALNIHTTKLGGEMVDLGGLVQMLHRHDRTKKMVIRLVVPNRFRTPLSLHSDLGDFENLPEMWIELTIRLPEDPSEQGRLTPMYRLRIGFDAESEVFTFIGRPCKAAIHWKMSLESLKNTLMFSMKEKLKKSGALAVLFPESEDDSNRFIEDSLAVFNNTLRFMSKSLLPTRLTAKSKIGSESFVVGRSLTDNYLPTIPSPDDESVTTETRDETLSLHQTYQDLVSDCEKYLRRDALVALLGLLGEIKRVFRPFLNMAYLGPLRAYPARTVMAKDDTGSNPDASGGEAWEMLIDHDDLRDKVNRWIGGEFVKTRYEFRVEEYVLRFETDRESEQVRRFLTLIDRRSGTSLTHRDVGMGISQMLPLLVRLFSAQSRILAIEQPELHLHPALQTELGDLLIEAALTRGNTLLVETHSEHLLLRIMRRMRETDDGESPQGRVGILPEDVVVLYVEPEEKGSVVYELPLSERGELLKRWPGGFFEEGLREMF